MHEVDGHQPRVAEQAELGLRERKKRACRSALIDAAQAIASRDGLDAVTVEGVCGEAGVSTRTFFNYFDSKVDAVLGIVPWGLDRAAVRAFVAGGPTGDLADDAAAFVAAVLAMPELDLRRTRTAMDLALGEPRLLARQFGWMEEHRASITVVVAQRLAASPHPAHPEVVSDLILMLLKSSLRRWEELGGTGSPAAPVPAVLEELRSLL